MVAASAALRALAVALMKIANDLRWLGSGPREASKPGDLGRNLFAEVGWRVNAGPYRGASFGQAI